MGRYKITFRNTTYKGIASNEELKTLRYCIDINKSYKHQLNIQGGALILIPKEITEFKYRLTKRESGEE